MLPFGIRIFCQWFCLIWGQNAELHDRHGDLRPTKRRPDQMYICFWTPVPLWINNYEGANLLMPLSTPHPQWISQNYHWIQDYFSHGLLTKDLLKRIWSSTTRHSCRHRPDWRGAWWMANFFQWLHPKWRFLKTVLPKLCWIEQGSLVDYSLKDSDLDCNVT